MTGSFQERPIRRVWTLLFLVALPLTVSAGSADCPDSETIQDEHVGGYYDECGEGSGVVCGDDLQCVTFGSNETGVCLPECESDDDCPLSGGRSLCEVSLEDGTSVCALDCTYARCPFGTICQRNGIRNICADW